MTRKAFLLMVAFVFCFTAAYASEEGESFWGSMKGRLQGLTSGSKTVTTAVGGVRGEKIKTYGELYWKGREQEHLIVPQEELAKFQAALDLAVDGKTEESLKAFEEFVALYPGSSLNRDATDAIERLKVDLFEKNTEPEAVVETPAGQQPLETKDAMIEEAEPGVSMEQEAETPTVEPEEIIEMEVAPEASEGQETVFQPEGEVVSGPDASGVSESGSQVSEPQDEEEELMDSEGEGDLWSIPK